MSADTLSLKEAAERAGVNYYTLRRALDNGTIPVPVLRIGRTWRIPRHRFLQWLAGEPPSPTNDGAAPAVPSTSP